MGKHVHEPLGRVFLIVRILQTICGAHEGVRGGYWGGGVSFLFFFLWWVCVFFFCFVAFLFFVGVKMCRYI